MLPLLSKTIARINDDLRAGAPVIATPAVSARAANAAVHATVDAVTTATTAQHLHNLPRPLPPADDPENP